MKLLMVLNDGETYSDLEGCIIVGITDSAASALEQGSLSFRELKYEDVTLEIPLQNKHFRAT